MRKSILFSLIFLSTACSGGMQNRIWFTGTFGQAFDKAAAENKYIVIDFSSRG